MKKISLALLSLAFITACNTTKTATSNTANAAKETTVHIDLVNVTNDQVQVEFTPAHITAETATFHIPKTVPGTYSTDNYGQYIENFKAFDKDGNELAVKHPDQNSWDISNANKLTKITYFVNDTFDTEATVKEAVFSPAGTNILKDKNFVLNLHGFVGYFTTQQEFPYTLNITHPEGLVGTSALTDLDAANTKDIYN